MILGEVAGNKAAATSCLNLLNSLLKIRSAGVISAIIELPPNLQNNVKRKKIHPHFSNVNSKLRQTASELSPELEEIIRKHIFDHNGLRAESNVITKEAEQQHVASRKSNPRNVASAEKIKYASSSKKKKAKEKESVEVTEHTSRKSSPFKTVVSDEDSTPKTLDTASHTVSLRPSEEMKTPEKKSMEDKSPLNKQVKKIKIKKKKAAKSRSRNLSLSDIDSWEPRTFDLLSIEHYIE